MAQTRTRPRSRSLPFVAALLALMVLVVAACGAEVPTRKPGGSVAGASSSPGGAGAGGASSDPAAGSGLVPCKAADMKATIASWDGNATSRVASIVITSRSGVTCTVRGRPGVRLLDGKNKIVLDSAKIKTVGGPKVGSDDPIVVLGTGDRLALDVQWTNWCSSQPVRPLTVHLVLTDRGGLVKAVKAKKSGEDDAPKCTARKAGSEVRVTHAWLGPGL